MKFDNLFEALTMGSYIGMKLSSRTIDYIKQLQTELGLKDKVTPDDMHITLIYSKFKSVPNGWLPCQKKIVYSGSGHLDLYGPDKDTLVLVLDDKSDLHKRHSELVAYGLKHSYDEFSPHITLSYNQAGLDLDSLPKTFFDDLYLEFVSEYENEIIPDWGKKKGA